MPSKETVLDDSASIYSRNRGKTEKQKWEEMSGAERFSYFKEYYLKFVILGILGVALLIYLGVTIFGPKPKQILYVAVVNDYIDDAVTEDMQKDLKAYLGSTDELEQVYFDDTFYFGDGSQDASNVLTKMMAFVAAGDIDIIISDPAQFEMYAKGEYFLDLRETLPASQYKKLEDKLVWCDVPNEDESATVSVPVGINLAGSKKYGSLKGYQESPVLGIVANSKNVDNVLKAIDYFFSD